MKVAIAASLVGAIVGELPTGAVAGIGAQAARPAPITARPIQIWSALVAGSLLAALLVAIVGLVRADRRSAAWGRGRHEQARAPPGRRWSALRRARRGAGAAASRRGGAALSARVGSRGRPSLLLAVAASASPSSAAGSAAPSSIGGDRAARRRARWRRACALAARSAGVGGRRRPGFWALAAARWLLAWLLVTRLSRWSGRTRAARRLLLQHRRPAPLRRLASSSSGR